LRHFTLQQVIGAQVCGAQVCGAQAAGSQQPPPSRFAWALETLITANKAATASAGNKIRRNMGGTPLLGKTLWDTHAKQRKYGVRVQSRICYRRPRR
jgi:hypothetical protein